MLEPAVVSLQMRILESEGIPGLKDKVNQLLPGKPVGLSLSVQKAMSAPDLMAVWQIMLESTFWCQSDFVRVGR